MKRDLGVQEEVDYLVVSRPVEEVHAARLNQPFVVGKDGKIYPVSPVYKPRLTTQEIEEAARNIRNAFGQ